jgi:FkbM family methyltransferase
MDNFFDKSLHHLGKTSSDVFVINIGAMDGVMFDEMFGYTNMYNFKGLYVEPIPYLYDKLKNNIGGNNLFENSAISDYDGKISMITIKKDVIDSGMVHDCFYGMSAIYPPKNGLGSEYDRPTVEKYGEMVNVNCITYNTLLRKHHINKIDVIKIDAEGHDYKIFKQINLKENQLKVIRLEWINLSKEDQSEIINIFNQNNFKYEITDQDIVGISSEFYNELLSTQINLLSNNQNNTFTEKNKATLVTGLWDISRDSLSNGWSRSYEDHYLVKFNQLLDVNENLIIFGDESLRDFVFKKRTELNTQFIVRSKNWFTQNDFYDKIQKIRTNSDWINQSSWIKDSTQCRLDFYNPLVMSKMYLLHDAKLLDKFDSDYMFWIDAGITNTVHPGYFTHDKVLDKLPKYINNFSFICFPYDGKVEIHGFKYDKMCEYSSGSVDKVARGGFFGGRKDIISEINSKYYHLMWDTLSNELMGTEESLFTIMTYKYPEMISYFKINGDGLIGTFFENLKNDSLKPVIEMPAIKSENNLDTSKVGLYVIGFNSPTQFKTLIDSFIEYDRDYLDKPKKYLLNNSTDLSTTVEYEKLCNEYGFEHIKNDNLGICGGRQWIAEHFDKTDLDYYLFFEDDMFFYPKKGEVCRNGFNRYVQKLYSKSLDIIKTENLDFLKLNFTEFFGDNGTQWSWYNVPQTVREEFWPENKSLPKQGIDPNAPKTNFDSIKSYKEIPYALGEVYYCNWPQIVSRDGNKKMFLDTTWAHPYEQTWMSHIYQLTKKGEIKSGLLLMTPTEHNRFEHYDGKLRKES